MAHEWFRLWHDMPNDPKWRTIARVAGQPLAVVLSVALHYMTDASRNVTRGHVGVTHEDVASALDVTTEAVQAIHDAMQGRVMDGTLLTGWEKRQPKREDQGDHQSGAKSAAQRKREQRERERAAAAGFASQHSHDASREVTTDKDKDKEDIPPKSPRKRGEASSSPIGIADLEGHGVSMQVAADFLALRAKKRAPFSATALAGLVRESSAAGLSLEDAMRTCTERGWTSLKASWIQDRSAGLPRASPGGLGVNKQEALERRNQEIGQRWASGPGAMQ